LDPAGPLFGGTAPSERLDREDADYVDVIHTDGLYGISDAIGHKDFFPNGGKSQVGCNPVGNFIDFLGGIRIGKRALRIEQRSGYKRNIGMPKFDAVQLVACNHFRVIEFYVESISSTSCKFIGCKCDKYGIN
jgi:hypothetical protein